MQVPTVTLEDLNAFRAAHFPGPHHPLIPPPTEPAEDYADDEAGDDLGYYPDGVKRALTDEQIRIFRHSEIHALLRARQLEQDDAEYEARRRDSGDEMGDAVMNEPGQSLHVEQVVPEKNGAAVSNGDTSARRGSKARIESVAQNTASESLDYGDRQDSSGKQPQSEARVQYPGRRIVSYAD